MHTSASAFEEAKIYRSLDSRIDALHPSIRNMRAN